jgi:hypothetical protein
MFKQSRDFICVFLAGFVLLGAQVSKASEEAILVEPDQRGSILMDRNNNDDRDNKSDLPSIFPEPILLSGEVRFESRFTRVHDVEGSDQFSQRSQRYWTLVIVSQGHRYVFNRQFNLGENFPPASVELAGKLLKAGTLVKVKGHVTSGSLLSSFVMQLENIQVIAGSEWICHSFGLESPNVNVHVWYDLTQGEGSYKIQVEQTCSSSIDPIATVHVAKVSLHPNEFVYSGSSDYSGQSPRGSKLELHIQTAPHQTLDLRSSLKIETLYSGNEDPQSWAGAVIPLQCSQSRLSTGE